MDFITIKTFQNIEIRYKIGSLQNRIWERCIDSIIIYSYYFLVSAIMDLFQDQSSISKGLHGHLLNYVLLFLFCLPIIFYSLLFETFMHGQTPGKKAMNLRVISLSGENPKISQFVLRWVFRILDYPVIALIVMAMTEKTQRIGDLVAGTLVIDIKEEKMVFLKIKDLFGQVQFFPIFPNA